MPLIADNARALYASLVIFAIVVAGLVLGRDVLIPLAISASLAFILSPIVAWLVARRVPHGLAVPGLVVTVVLALAGLTAVFSAQVVSLAGELSTYQANLVQKVRTLAEAAKSEGALKRAAESLAALEKNITSELKQQETVPATTGQQRVVVAVDGSSAGAVVRHVSTLLHPLAQTGLVLLFTLFILLQSQDLRDRVARVAGTDNLSATTSALSDAADRLSQLFLTQAAMNIAFGTVIGMLLWAIGVPNSALWGSLTIVMRFVPFIGSLIAAIPPVLLAAAVEPGWGMALAALAIFVVAEPLMGHVIEPLVLGPKAGLSLFAMLAAASFWALVWGPIGLILAAPITMTLVVLGHYVKGLSFMSVLLGDEPALLPEQQFYQRVLAGDSLAAIQQLESAASDTSLVEIGDRIVLPAFRIAAADLDSGRIDRERAEAIRVNAALVTDELDPERRATTDTDDPAADPATENGVAMVVPARSRIDVAIAGFIAHAIGATVPMRATAFVEATGLTALGQAVAGTVRVEAVVIVSSGGADAPYLPLIARRAQRNFPGARVVILDLSQSPAARAPQSSGTTSNQIMCARLVDVIGHLRHARRASTHKTVEPATDVDAAVAGSLQVMPAA